MKFKVCLLLFIGCLQFNSTLGQSFKRVGYLPTYRFSLANSIAFDKLTHLNIAFANPDASGNLQTDGVSITSVVEKAHDAQLNVFIALAGGAASLNVWENWITPQNRSGFISGIMKYLHTHNLQGVDVDLEWSVINNDYSGFVLELKDSLSSHDFIMSAALPGTFRYPEVSDEALAAFEWVNLMAYDLTGPWASQNSGPHSPYSFAEQSITYWAAQGLEKNRMVLGVPFYGYDFRDVNNVKSVTFGQMVDKNRSNAMIDQVGSIYYNGLPTISKKTKLAMEKTSGIMIWELGQDSFDDFSLLAEIDRTIQGSPLVLSAYQEEIVAVVAYPNPVVDMVYLPSIEGYGMEHSLCNALGMEMSVPLYHSVENTAINMSNLPAGVYYLSLNNKSQTKVFRLVKL